MNYNELIDAFNAEGTERNQITRDWYADRLRKFFEFLTNQGINLKQVGPAEINRFLGHLYTQKLSWSTRNGTYTALQNFYKWAIKRRHVEVNPFEVESIKRPRKPQRLKKCPQFEAFRTLLRAIKNDESLQAKRDLALCLLLVDTGMRKMEAIALNINQVNLETGAVPLLVTKNDNQRRGYIKPPTVQAIKDWLAVHPRGENLKNPLFISLNGPTQFQRLNPRTVNGLLITWSAYAHLPNHVKPHDFRRLFATVFAQNGGGMNILQTLLGHANMETTMGYITTFEEEVRRQHDRYSPINFLNLD